MDDEEEKNIRQMGLEDLIDVYEASIKVCAVNKEAYEMRHLIMAQLEKYDKKDFNRWLRSATQSPREFFN